MDRQSWTELDEKVTWRRWVGWKHDLDDAEVLPHHLRDASRDPHWLPQVRPRRPRHVADEEPSRGVTVWVVPSWVVLAAVGTVLTVGVAAAFRSLFG